MKQGYKVTLLVLLVLIIDQVSKFYIKTHFEYNEEIAIAGLDWARLHFVENEGMAFGITFDWVYGKLLLSLFRIVMVAGLIWYIRMLIQAKSPAGFVYSVGLITAGAIGNILDSAFYGLIFSESSFHTEEVAKLVPFGEGYGTFLHGKVVDMLYFPMKWISMPEWVPYIGGEQYLFFSPIFNVADAAITTGVVCILLFQRSFFRDGLQEPPKTSAALSDADEPSDDPGTTDPSDAPDALFEMEQEEAPTEDPEKKEDSDL
jgi:signal peptidase II